LILNQLENLQCSENFIIIAYPYNKQEYYRNVKTFVPGIFFLFHNYFISWVLPVLNTCNKCVNSCFFFYVLIGKLVLQTEFCIKLNKIVCKKSLVYFSIIHGIDQPKKRKVQTDPEADSQRMRNCRKVWGKHQRMKVLYVIPFKMNYLLQ